MQALGNQAAISQYRHSLYIGGPKTSAGNSSAHWKDWHVSFCLHMKYGLKGFFSDLDTLKVDISIIEE